MRTYIVIKQEINSFEGPSDVYWDGVQYESYYKTVQAGFSKFHCDDFNIGYLENGKLTSFRWMDNPHPDTDRDRVAQQLGLA
jgi:hypothetical protein